MTVVVQDVGEHGGLAEQGFGRGNAVARAAGLDDIGLDPAHGMTSGDKDLDHEAQWVRDGDGQGLWRRDALQVRPDPLDCIDRGAQLACADWGRAGRAGGSAAPGLIRFTEWVIPLSHHPARGP